MTNEHVSRAADQILDVTRHQGTSEGVAAKSKTSELIGIFIKDARRRSRANADSHQTDRYRYEVSIDPETHLKIDALRGLTFRLLISDQRVSTLEARAELIITSLFGYFLKASALNSYPERFRLEFQEARANQTARARIACDYISGMTDEYAQRLYRRLFTAERSALNDF